MFRFAACLLLSLSPLLAWAEEIMPLTIGGTEVRVALPDRYVRASEKAPALFATSAAALPPGLRLVEAVLTESDLKHSVLGQPMQQPYLQVQTLRDAESVSFSTEEWRQLQPALAQQLGATDLTKTKESLQSGMGERMSDASGTAVAIEFGEIGKPKVYSQANDVIRYVVRLPFTSTVNGSEVQMVLECAGAVFVLQGKLVTFNAYLRQDEQNDSSAKVRAFLDTAVARAQALNAAAKGTEVIESRKAD